MTDQQFTWQLKQASSLIQQQRHTEALDILKRLHHTNQHSPELWWLIARAYAPFNPRRAHYALKRCLRLRPDSPQAQEALAKLEARHPDLAVPALSTALPLPDAPPPLPECAPPPAQAVAAVAPAVAPVPTVSAEAARPAPPLSPLVPTNPTGAGSESSENIVAVSGTVIFADDAPPAETRLVPAAEAPPDQPAETIGAGEAAAGGCAATLLAVPVGGYIVATAMVIEVIVGYIGMSLQALFEAGHEMELIVTIVLVLLLLIPGVIIGGIAAIGGAVAGGVGGFLVGLINMVVVTLTTWIYRPLACLIAPLLAGGFAVWLYHEYAIETARDLAEMFSVPWLADINYILVFLVGLLISAMSLGAAEGADAEEANPLTEEFLESITAPPGCGLTDTEYRELYVSYIREKEDAETKEALNALAAPWRMFGKIAKKSVGVSAATWGVTSDFVEDAVDDNPRHIQRRRLQRQLEETERELRRLNRALRA